LPENNLALDLYYKIKSLGAGTVFKMAAISLTQAEADELLEKMALIARVVNDWQAQQKTE